MHYVLHSGCEPSMGKTTNRRSSWFSPCSGNRSECPARPFRFAQFDFRFTVQASGYLTSHVVKLGRTGNFGPKNASRLPNSPRGLLTAGSVLLCSSPGPVPHPSHPHDRRLRQDGPAPSSVLRERVASRILQTQIDNSSIFLALL